MRRLPTREEAGMHQLLTVGEAGERGLYCHHTTTTDASCWDSQQTTTHDFEFVTSPFQDHAMSIGDSAAAANCLSLCLTLSSIVRGGAGTTPTPSPYYYSAKHTLSHAGPRIAC